MLRPKASIRKRCTSQIATITLLQIAKIALRQVANIALVTLAPLSPPAQHLRASIVCVGVRLVPHVDSIFSPQWLLRRTVEDLLSPSLGDLWQTFAPSTDDAA